MKMTKKICFALMLALVPGLAVFAQSGIISDLTGKVELKPAGARSFAAARIGDMVAKNTIISTADGSTAAIAVGSTTVFTRPRTRLSLAEMVSGQNSESVNLQLYAGQGVQIDVHPGTARARAGSLSASASSSAAAQGGGFDTARSIQRGNGNGTVVYINSGGEDQVYAIKGTASLEITRAGDSGSPVQVRVKEPLPPAYGRQR